MNYDVIATDGFEKILKRLSKKYRSLRQEVIELGETLAENPTQGQSLGRSCYKIRLAIKSKGAGKSGGARVISCVVAVQEKVVLLTMYDKSEQSTITDDELEQLLKANELN